MNTPFVQPITTPAERLAGLTTPQGWQIVQLVRQNTQQAAGLTGANFSCGYLVERKNPKTGHDDKAFLKALDIERGLVDSNNLLEGLRSSLNLVLAR